MGYNSLFQLTQITAGSVNIQYAYPAAGANNGKISSQTDVLSGEIVTYTYDSLSRLISANSTIAGQSQTFGYDGFGNLVSKPPLSVNVDPATNRLAALGMTYDGNGNLIYQPGMTGNYNYDVENRMTSAPGVQYGYDGQNKRNYKAVVNSGGAVTSEEFYFYGADGKKIGTYQLQAIAVGGPANLTLTFSGSGPGTLVYFRGRVLGPQDRLGSFGKYYPYGEEKGTATANDALKFATYTRDAATGLDYADQRYYSSQFGRFMSADPYMASGGAGDPGSWNRYSYVLGDPINYLDPSGLTVCGFVGSTLVCYDSVQVTASVSPIPYAWAPISSYLIGAGDSSKGPNNCNIDKYAKADCDPNVDYSQPECPDDMPINPSRGTLYDNLNLAVQQKESAFRRIKAGEDAASVLTGLAVWFYGQVRNKGPWYYKQQNASYQDFGNYDYGATGAALGFSQDFLARFAGWAQVHAGTSSSDPSFGTPGWLIVIGGTSPYGDDPRDNQQLTAGFAFAQAWIKGCRKSR